MQTHGLNDKCASPSDSDRRRDAEQCSASVAVGLVRAVLSVMADRPLCVDMSASINGSGKAAS